MKTIIFIDGENFVYQLRDMLAKRRLIKYRDELSRVDIRKMLADVFEDESIKQAKIQYYAAKVHIIDRTPELKERTERYAADAASWEKALTDQNIEYVHAGHLLVRDGKPCQVCGHAEPVLVEKGVDIRFATDVMRASGENVRIILLSSDGDMLPAIEESVRRGAELWYLGFRGVSNAALARVATKRFMILAKHAVGALGPKPQPKPTEKSESQQPKQDRSNNQSNNGRQSQKNQGQPRAESKSTGLTTGSRLAGMLMRQTAPPKAALSKSVIKKPARTPRKTNKES
ncbi:MAG: NYN domain-containing protein [bacterium]